MKKFQFSLDKMLHYKQTLLDKEKDSLRALRGERDALEAAMERNHLHMLETDATLKQRARCGTTILELRMLEFQIENARQLIKQQEAELVEWNRRVEEQLAVVLAITQEVSGLEKLEEKQHKEHNYLVQRQESETLIEIVAAKYARAH